MSTHRLHLQGNLGVGRWGTAARDAEWCPWSLLRVDSKKERKGYNFPLGPRTDCVIRLREELTGY